MKTKIVYVLVAEADSLYIQQLIVSIYSLRLHNESAHVTLVVDQDTAEILSKFPIREHNLEIKSVRCPESLTKQQRSRYLKTSLRQLISGDYLFIDTDTIICADLSEIDGISYDVAAVKDKHQSILTHPLKNEIVKWGGKVGWDIDVSTDEYFNSGVMYVKDSVPSKKLYDIWHRRWSEGISSGVNLDQPSLGLADRIAGGVIKELPGVWNCQITDNGLKYLTDAKIIHYFASMQKWDTSAELPYILRDSMILERIKKNGNQIPESVKGMIINARSQFRDDVIIFSGRNVEICRLRLFRIFRKLYFRFPKLIGNIDRIISSI